VWAYGAMMAHMGTGKIPYEQLKLKSRNAMLDVIKSGEVSPLELLVENPATPKAIIELAKKCCDPNPASRPRFQDVSEILDQMLPEDAPDPRPMARIKNKKIARIGGGKDDSVEASTSGAAPNAELHSTFRGDEDVSQTVEDALQLTFNQSFQGTFTPKENSYRAKFRQKSDSFRATDSFRLSPRSAEQATTSFTLSPRSADAVAGDAGASSSAAEEKPAEEEKPMSFLDSFAMTLQRTFTPQAGDSAREQGGEHRV
jgi:serine/threonine protein kinase